MLNLEQHEPADLASFPLMAIAKNVCLRGVVMGGAEKSVILVLCVIRLRLRLVFVFIFVWRTILYSSSFLLVLTPQLSVHDDLALRIPCQSPPMYR